MNYMKNDKLIKNNKSLIGTKYGMIWCWFAETSYRFYFHFRFKGKCKLSKCWLNRHVSRALFKRQLVTLLTYILYTSCFANIVNVLNSICNLSVKGQFYGLWCFFTSLLRLDIEMTQNNLFDLRDEFRNEFNISWLSSIWKKKNHHKRLNLLILTIK